MPSQKLRQAHCREGVEALPPRRSAAGAAGRPPERSRGAAPRGLIYMLSPHHSKLAHVPSVRRPDFITPGLHANRRLQARWPDLRIPPVGDALRFYTVFAMSAASMKRKNAAREVSACTPLAGRCWRAHHGHRARSFLRAVFCCAALSRARKSPQARHICHAVLAAAALHRFRGRRNVPLLRGILSS